MKPARQRILILGLIVVGIAIIGFFGFRAVHAFREFRGHRPHPFPPAEAQPVETDVELIRDWMTIPYIAMTYHVSPRILFDAIGISPRGNEEKSLSQLNDEFFPQTPEVVIELIKTAVQANQVVPTTALPDASTPPAAP